MIILVKLVDMARPLSSIWICYHLHQSTIAPGAISRKWLQKTLDRLTSLVREHGHGKLEVPILDNGSAVARVAIGGALLLTRVLCVFGHDVGVEEREDSSLSSLTGFRQGDGRNRTDSFRFTSVSDKGRGRERGKGNRKQI